MSGSNNPGCLEAAGWFLQVCPEQKFLHKCAALVKRHGLSTDPVSVVAPPLFCLYWPRGADFE